MVAKARVDSICPSELIRRNVMPANASTMIVFVHPKRMDKRLHQI